MKACFDVHYDDHGAAAAALVFDQWQDAEPVDQYSVRLSEIGEYEPGKFYLRELKPLAAVIEKISQPIDTFIIDAYCYLDGDQAPGLGFYLYESLRKRFSEVPELKVIGVAKNPFRGSDHAQPVLRGDSTRPLWITSIGVDPVDAAAQIRSMDGEFRMPTLLRKVDQDCRAALIDPAPQ